MPHAWQLLDGIMPLSPGRSTLRTPLKVPSFQEALLLLTQAHSHEVNQVREACDLKLSLLSQEVLALRARLRAAGVSAQDAGLAAEDVQPPVAVGGPLGPGPAGGGLGAGPANAAGVLGKLAAGGEATTFTVKAAWESLMEGAAWGSALDPFLVRSGSEEKADESQGVTEDHQQRRDRHVILPNSLFRMNWDFVGLFLICYDVITIPFNQAFQPPSGWLSITMDWITLLFWTGDMIQGFFLGYFEKGELVTSRRRILWHYLRTWFLVDILVVGPDWIMLLFAPEGDTSAAGAGKILKSARAMRILRLLRLAKVQRMLNLLYDLIESEFTFIVINLTKLLFSVLVLNHVVACLWYLTGKLAIEQEMMSWIDLSGIAKEDIPYAYTTSLHWSLTQFTPASMDVSAKNIFERVYSIVILFLSMVVFSSIVGSISGSMTSLRSMKSDQMKQFWLLRRYLRQRSVPKGLSSRIYKYLEHQCLKQNNHVQPGQIKVLEGLSESLRNELMHEMHSPHLLDHPFFLYLNNEMAVVMHRLCRVALGQQSYAEREVVFGAGDEAKKVYFVKGGSLDYKLMDRTVLRPPPRPKEWISEALLWTAWRHRGDLVALIESELILVDPAQFVSVMNLHPRPWFYAKQYATKFVEFLNRLGREAVSDIIRDTLFYGKAVNDIEWRNSFKVTVSAALRGTARCEEAACDAEPDASIADAVGITAATHEDGPERDTCSGATAQQLLCTGAKQHAGPQTRSYPPAVQRCTFGFCPCPGPLSTVFPGPSAAVTWR
uniref:Ion transport domain-containing protein n=1 Tax=Pyrodinium bahamense TaxID=73915 RepID=A0A7R9ZVQ3_9DINO|mmetsp:Transcript_11878/g.32569  ORF Transcript_11878/g.32569 Transcript_11878/m.32569 type:complete len:775 (+) Transcript_11878:96-2420(+)